jgi:hypothetical protein
MTLLGLVVIAIVCVIAAFTALDIVSRKGQMKLDAYQEYHNAGVADALEKEKAAKLKAKKRKAAQKKAQALAEQEDAEADV